MRAMTLAAACLILAACTTTAVRSAAGLPAAPPAGARILLAQPDVELGLLTTSGLPQARADWTAAARTNLRQAVETALRARSHRVSLLDPQAAMAGREGQLLRLNGEVGRSILLYQYGGGVLPTKRGGFDWTLGEGARALGEARGADYALFVHGRGGYPSVGRMVAGLVVGGPDGKQQVFASLVDLKTGRVVWFNVANPGPDADMRTAEGAEVLTVSLLKGLPL